jgi:uncharacterized membrane protein YphA (DoxX/SURF4 family)
MLTITVELIGSVLILWGRFLWLGAGMLVGFTSLAAIIAQAFWTMQGRNASMATNVFFGYLGLIGGWYWRPCLLSGSGRGD